MINQDQVDVMLRGVISGEFSAEEPRSIGVPTVPVWGLWHKDSGWTRLGDGRIFHTDRECVAYAQLTTMKNPRKKFSIERIDLWFHKLGAAHVG